MPPDAFDPDTVTPKILNVRMPEGSFGIGSEVAVSIAVHANDDVYSLVAGTVGGYKTRASRRSRTDSTTRCFTVTEHHHRWPSAGAAVKFATIGTGHLDFQIV